jgi:hypothetical protein
VRALRSNTQCIYIVNIIYLFILMGTASSKELNEEELAYLVNLRDSLLLACRTGENLDKIKEILKKARKWSKR